MESVKTYQVKVGIKGNAESGHWLQIRARSQDRAILIALDGRPGYEVRAVR